MVIGLISFLFFIIPFHHAFLFVFYVKIKMKQLSYIMLCHIFVFSGYLKRHFGLFIGHGKFLNNYHNPFSVLLSFLRFKKISDSPYCVWVKCKILYNCLCCSSSRFSDSCILDFGIVSQYS